jgi:hypothetical protein
MTTLQLTNIPPHLQGELFKILTTEFTEEDTPLNQRNIWHFRSLKTDLKIRCLRDILQMMDTCMFFAAPLHRKIFEFVEGSPEYIIQEMREFESGSESSEYGFFVTTEEYRALKLLATYKRTWTWSVQGFLEYAIKNGSLVLIEHYTARYRSVCAVLPLKWAVEYGKIPIMAFLVKQPWISVHNHFIHTEQTLAQQLCSDAVGYDQLPMLKYLHETLQFPWDQYVVQFSLCEERLHILKYALENGCPIPSYGLNMALGMDSIEGLRMLVEMRNIPLEDDEKYTLLAAQNGNVEHLRYLHEKNARWHPQAVNTAARNKYVDCVEFGISVNAPYDSNIVAFAYQPFRLDVDHWIGLQIYHANHYV